MGKNQPVMKTIAEILTNETMAEITEIAKLVRPDKVKIKSGTFLSRLITGILHSKATAIGNTVFFNEYFMDIESPDLELLSHELVHIRQNQEHGMVCFLIRYIWEYARQTATLTINMWKEVGKPGWKSFKNAYRQAWWKVHFEQEAVEAENQYRKKFGRKSERRKTQE